MFSVCFMYLTMCSSAKLYTTLKNRPNNNKEIIAQRWTHWLDLSGSVLSRRRENLTDHILQLVYYLCLPSSVCPSFYDIFLNPLRDCYDNGKIIMGLRFTFSVWRSPRVSFSDRKVHIYLGQRHLKPRCKMPVDPLWPEANVTAPYNNNIGGRKWFSSSPVTIFIFCLFVATDEGHEWGDECVPSGLMMSPILHREK